MQYTINELRQELFKEVLDVYGIFKHFYGEAHTDLQHLPTDEMLKDDILAFGGSYSSENYNIDDKTLYALKNNLEGRVYDIIVWWPNVTVTNENGKSIVINDLYAKITISSDGTIPYEYHGFQMLRSTYTKAQLTSGYLHSHCPALYHCNLDKLREWESPCLGTGPIRNTIHNLKGSNDETTWMLFCQELSLYVTVESLTGGPYIKLESVGVTRELVSHTRFTSPKSIRTFDFVIQRDHWKEFIAYYLQNGHFSVNYQDGEFKSGLSYFNYIIDISNAFIDWFNQWGDESVRDNLYNYGQIIKALASEGKFYENKEPEDVDFTNLQGHTILTFKGSPMPLYIIEENEEREKPTVTILDHTLAMVILQNILRIINYRYTNEYNREHSDSSSDGETATAYKNFFYVYV